MGHSAAGTGSAALYVSIRRDGTCARRAYRPLRRYESLPPQPGRSQSRGSWHTAEKPKTGLLVSPADAVFVGGALAWANWPIDVGTKSRYASTPIRVTRTFPNLSDSGHKLALVEPTRRRDGQHD
ncbi:MAG: DUF6112 family protein [Rubrobacteraceae bacterium]